MKFEFLKPEQQARVDAILKKHGITEFSGSPWIEIWHSELVQIDGDVTLQELRCLVEIMESLQPSAKSP